MNLLKGANSRTAMVLRNVAASSLMKVASLFCSLIMVPITLDYLDIEAYGIWMAMTSILFWFAFFDIGLGNGMRNYLSASFSEGDMQSAKKYISTAMIILSGIAVIMAIIAIPAIYFFNLNDVFNTQVFSNNELACILVFAVVMTLVNFVVKNIGMVYIAMQKYAINDFILFLGNIISVAVIYILTKTTEGNLMYIVMVLTGIPVLMFILSAIPLFIKYPQLTISWKCVDTGIARKVVSKGLGFFIIQITSCLVIFGSANILMLHYCGAEQVTEYNISYKLFNLLAVAYTIFISPLWNAYTDAYVKNDYDWIRRTLNKSLVVWMCSFIAGIILLFVSPYFFDWWVGQGRGTDAQTIVNVPIEVSACVLMYISAFNLNNCVTYLLNGLNKIRVQIITSVVGTLLYLAIIFAMQGTQGVVGISITMAGVYLAMALVHLYQCRLLIKRKAEGIWNV